MRKGYVVHFVGQGNTLTYQSDLEPEAFESWVRGTWEGRAQIERVEKFSTAAVPEAKPAVQEELPSE